MAFTAELSFPLSRGQQLDAAPPRADRRPVGCSRVFTNTETGEPYDIDELPELKGVPVRIDRFISNKAYRAKYAAMCREGQLPYLLALADRAEEKDFPENYFAKCASKENWAATRRWVFGEAQKYQPLWFGTIPQYIEVNSSSMRGGASWSDYAGPGDEVFIPNIPLEVHFQRFGSKTSHGDAWHRFPVFGYPGECITWQGKPTKDGYGRFSVDGKTYAAHRYAYEVAYGPLPPKIQVDHKCRNRLCVNPAHLEAVTQQVNLSRRQYSPTSFPPKRKLSESEKDLIARKNRDAARENAARQRAHQQNERIKRERQREAEQRARIRGELDGVITQIVDLIAVHNPGQERERITRIVEGTVQREESYGKVLSPEKQIERAREMLAYNQDKYGVRS